jgi:hypothetical protein
MNLGVYSGGLYYLPHRKYKHHLTIPNHMILDLRVYDMLMLSVMDWNCPHPKIIRPNSLGPITSIS